MGCISVKWFGSLKPWVWLFGLGLWGQLGLGQSLILTSSLRGSLSNLPTPAQSPAGLLHLEAHIKQLKNGSKAIWVDTGDLLLGSPQAQLQGTSSPFLSQIQAAGLDLVVPGEGDLSQLNQDLPWTSANLWLAGKRPFPAYRVFTRKGQKIVILGLCAALRGVEKSVPTGLKITNPIKAAQAWVPKLRKTEKPDLLVVVFHGNPFSASDREDSLYRGFEPDLGAMALAQNVPGIDLLLFGHRGRQSLVWGAVPFSGGTWAYQGGSWGRDLLQLTKKAHTWKAQVFAAQPVDRGTLATVLGTGYLAKMSSPLHLRLKRTSKAALSRCLNDLLSVAQIGLGGVGTGFSKVYLKAQKTGPLTYATLFRWFPFDDHRQWLWVSQRDLALLAHPAATFGKTKPPYRRQVYLKLNQPLNLDLATVGISRSARKRVYKLWVTGYHLRGGGAILPMLFTELPHQPQGPFLRDSVSAFLAARKELPPSCPMLVYQPTRM